MRADDPGLTEEEMRRLLGSFELQDAEARDGVPGAGRKRGSFADAGREDQAADVDDGGAAQPPEQAVDER